MMQVTGYRLWDGGRDEEGYRTFNLTTRLKCESKFDGPFTALSTPGIFLPGSPWVIGNDADFWVWCRPTATLSPVAQPGRPNLWWDLKQVFSNKPPEDKQQRCNDTQIEDPLQEPPKVSGSFQKFTKEMGYDRYGERIINPAHELVRGPQVEFDDSRLMVKIEQNVLDLEFPLLTYVRNKVNMSPLWGMPARHVKCSSISFERLFYGTCFKYYKRSFEFEGADEGWDRDIMAEGTKVLNGRWSTASGTAGGTGWLLQQIGGEDPDPTNPAHFIRAIDRQGNPVRMPLTIGGLPAGVPNLVEITSMVYDSSGFIVITTATPHDFEVGDEVQIQGARPDAYNGVRLAYSIPAPSELEIAVAANPGIYAGGGTIVGDEGPANIHVEYYKEAEFLLLGIPLEL